MLAGAVRDHAQHSLPLCSVWALTCACGAQAVANESGSTVALTDIMKQVLMDRVDSYGNHHTLRCLALASKPMPSSNEPVLPTSYLDSPGPARSPCDMCAG